MALGEAFITIRADTSEFRRELADGLQGIVRSVRVPPVVLRAQLNAAAAVNGLNSLTAAAATTAHAMTIPFSVAAKAIAADLSTLAASGELDLGHISTAGTRAAEALAASFGLSAHQITPAFVRAGEDIAAALARSANSGEVSLLGLQRVAEAAAFGIRSSLVGAAASAALGFSGALGPAAAAAITALQRLRSSGATALEPLGEDGTRVARLLLAEFERTATAVRTDFAAAAKSIASDLEHAASLGKLGFKDMARDIQRTAREAFDAVAKAAEEEAADLSRVFQRARELIAKDLAALARSGNLSMAEITEAARVATATLRSLFGVADNQLTAEFAAVQERITAELARIAEAGQTSAADLSHAMFTAARDMFGDIRTAVLGMRRELGGLGTPDPFVPLVAEASAAAAKIRKVFDGAVDKLKSGFSTGASKAASGLKALITGTAVAGAVITGFALKGAADLESLKVSFDNVFANSPEATKGFKDAKAASDAFFVSLNQLANTTTFEIKPAGDLALQLATIGIKGQAAIGALLSLGDAAAAAGKDPNQLGGVVTALAQINSLGKLTQDNLNQISNQLPGFNQKLVKTLIGQDKAFLNSAAVVKKFGKVTSLTAGQVQELADQGEITAGVAIPAIFKALGTGTKGALAAQALTLKGAFSNFKSSVTKSLTDAFAPVLPQITAGLNSLAPKLGAAFARIGPVLAKNLTDLFPLIEANLPALVDGFIAITKAIGASLPVIISAIAAVTPVITGLFNAFTDNLPTVIAFVTQLAANLAPIVAPARDIALAIGAVAAISLDVLTQAVGNLGIFLAPIATALKDIAAALFVISQSTAGKVLLDVAAAAIAIAAAAKAVEVLRGLAIGLGLISAAGGAAGAGGALGFLASALGKVSLAIGATIVAADLLYNKISQIAGSTDTLLGDTGKFFSGIGDGFVNATQGAGNFFSTIANTIPGVHIDTTEFNAKLDDMNDRLIGFGQTKATAVLDADPSGALNAVNQVRHAFAGLGVFTSGSQPSSSIDFPATPNTPESTAAILAQRAQDKARQELDRFLTSLKTSGGGGTTGAGTGGSNVDKAKAAADQFAERIRAILKGLDDDFRSGLLKGSADAVRKSLNSLISSITEAFADAGRKTPSGLIARIRADNRTLQLLANERDRLAQRIADANAKFTATKSSALAFAAITGAATDAVNVTQAAAKTISATLEVTTLDIAGSFQVVRKTLNDAVNDPADPAKIKLGTANLVTAFQERLNTLRSFRQDIDAIAKAGLDKTVIDQLISAGVEGGAASADVIAKGGSAVIKQINDIQAQINTEGNRLGVTAVDSAFRSGSEFVHGVLASLKDSKSVVQAGIKTLVDNLLAAVKTSLNNPEDKVSIGASVVAGIVAGLRAGRKDVRAEIADLITDLVAEVKRRLKISSPSGVFRDLFAHVPTGAALGIGDGLGHVSQAANALADAALAGVSLPDLQTPLAAALGALGTPSLDVLARLQLGDAQRQLSSLGLPAMDIGELRRDSGGGSNALSRQDIAELRGIMGMARSQTVHNAPITQNFNGGGGLSPASALAHMNAAVSRGLRG